jgi:hypothetical protein
MNKQSLKVFIVLVLLVTLLAADFIILGQGIAIAIYESLETQGNTTNVKNVEFDSYFLSNGEKVHYKECNLDEEETLNININVKESGLLKDAKIKIENANFELVNDDIQNSYIKNINVSTNEIELNEIIYQNNVVIEIPIKFKKQESFEEDYFEKESTISLQGTYKDEKEQEVSGQIQTIISWKQQVDVNISSEIEKYIDLGNNGILLQQNVTTQVVDNKLPRESETLNLQVPEIDEQIPEEVVVLLNGEKLSDDKVTYNNENKSLEIKNETKGTWGTANNEYKIIYQYSADIEFATKTITLVANMKTKLYTQDEIEKQNEQTVEISAKGNIASINKEVTSEIYKGYLYVNSTNETNFEEYNHIEISNVTSIDKIEVEKAGETFENEQQNTFDVSEKILYKETVISKAEFLRIFGTEGEILIKDREGNTINTINKDSETNENGNILISYDEEIDYIKIETSKPVCEGVITIANARAIKGDTGYNKNQLKSFTKLLTKEKVSTNVSEEIAQAETILNDTKTEAKIEINNSNLSTLQTNESVQLLVTLKSDSEQYDLFKNPNVEIVFPKELELTVKNVSQLNGQEELQIIDPKLYVNDNGETIISLPFSGEQTEFENSVNEGIQVSITADINVDKTTPSHADKIAINYTNENRVGENFTSYADINLNSKYGVLTVNNLSGYNANNDSIEQLDNGIETANLDTASEGKDATQKVSIVNNYETAITDVSIIGKIPATGEEELDNETVKSNFEMYLKNVIQTEGQVAKVYYSEDANADTNSDTWSENIADIATVKAFKVELVNNEIQAGSVINLLYNIEIPEGLEYNKSAYSKLTLNYNYAGETYTTNSIFVLKTDEVYEMEETEEEQIVQFFSSSVPVSTDDIQVQVLAKTAEGILSDGQDVMEGQKIKYILQITNNSSETIQNINIEATHGNAIYWNHNEYEALNSISGETEVTTRYEENESLDKETFTIESLGAGKSTLIEYQISVKEVEDNNQKLTGNIKIQADGIEEENIEITSNNIKKASLNLKLIDSFWEQTLIGSEGGFPIEFEVKNITDQEMENVIVELPLTEEVYFTEEEFYETDNVKFVEYKDKVVKFKINKIGAGETVSFTTQLIVEEIPIEKTSASTTISFNVKANDITYYSNEISREFCQNETEIVATQASDNEKEYIETGDEIIFTATIENRGSIALDIEIDDTLPDGAVIKDAYLLVDGQREEVDIMESFNNVNKSLSIEGNQTVQLVIETEINTDYITEDSITNYVTIAGGGINLKTNEITYKVQHLDDDEDDDEEEDDDEDYDEDDDEDYDEYYNEDYDDEDDDGNDPNIEYFPDDDEDMDNPNDSTDSDGSSNPDDSTGTGDSNNSDNSTNPSNPTNSDNQKETYSISGIAWVDSNKNGKRDSSEEKLKNIEVILLEANKGTVAKNNSNSDLRTTTKEDGSYTFEGVNAGSYMVVFKYDSGKYRVTAYNAEGPAESSNSDVISKNITIDGEQKDVAITGTLEVKNSNLENIDAGFIQSEKFDLKLDKYINKIIVQNNSGTTVREYNNTQLAKVEIDSKQISGSTVIVEYNIQITNEGELAGYVNEIVDYMPSDLSFSSELNKNWYQLNNGELYSKELSNDIINPGDSKTVTLTLVKTMNQNNTGTSINTAEISKASNDFSIEDIDSTPGNKVSGEDDISTAQVIISVKTGGVVMYTLLIAIIIAVIGIGVYFIKKDVLGREEGENE